MAVTPERTDFGHLSRLAAGLRIQVQFAHHQGRAQH
jgi:hypothetical protein